MCSDARAAPLRSEPCVAHAWGIAPALHVRQMTPRKVVRYFELFEGGLCESPGFTCMFPFRKHTSSQIINR